MKAPIKVFVVLTLASFALFGCSTSNTNADSVSPAPALEQPDDTAYGNQPTTVDQLCLAQAKTEEELLACVVPRQPD